MNHEWDDTKRLTNREKHRVDFVAIYDFEWETAIIEFDDRHDEPRWTAKGIIGATLYFVVFTDRDGQRRIISLRKATRREARSYVESQAQDYFADA